MGLFNIYGAPLWLPSVGAQAELRDVGTTHFEIKAGLFTLDFDGDFVLDLFQEPDSGQVTGIALATAGIPSLQATGLALDLQTLISKMSNLYWFEEYLFSGNDTINGSAAPENLNGLAGDNLLNGAGGNDTLTGGSGHDTLVGGTGDDQYIVDHDGTMLVESPGGGVDTVVAGSSFTLADNIERLVSSPYTSFGLVEFTGNSLANYIEGGGDTYTQFLLEGGAGNDTLESFSSNDTVDGGTGDDLMRGTSGHQLYIVDSAGDVVDDMWGGSDTVETTLHSYTLPGIIETLVLLGGAVDGTGNDVGNHLVGNALANHLWGGAGNDTFTGGGGADMLAGGEGDDHYKLAGNETVIEAPGEGIDTIEVGASYTLPADVDVLVLTGTGPMTGTGNAVDNRIVGNNDANVLDGGVGADSLFGGAGSDSFVIDNAGDTVSDAHWDDSFDTVYASVSFDLADHLYIENLTLTGTDNIDGVGNANVSNLIIGNSGNNHLTARGWDNTLEGGAGNDLLTGAQYGGRLNGGTGVDTLVGSTAKDIYVVDDSRDVIVSPGPAVYDYDSDIVLAWADYVLPGGIGFLQLQGSADISATSDHYGFLDGNAGDNTLRGGGEMHGGDGDDTIYVDATTGYARGELGDDTYVMTGANPYAVNEFYGEGNDTIVYLPFATGTLSLQADYAIENIVALGGDALLGNALDNTLSANAGANWLAGAEGADLLRGMAGDDTLTGGAGDDTLNGDGGRDVARYLWDSGAYTVTRGVAGHSTVSGPEGTDSLFGIAIVQFADTQVVLDAHTATGNVHIAGDRHAGHTLTSTVGALTDADGLGAAQLQWYRDDTPIEGATSASYLLTSKDEDAHIGLRASFIDGAGNFEAIWSNTIDTDMTAPRIISVSVAGRSDVLTSDSIVVGFDEAVSAGAGAVVLKDTDGTVIHTFDTHGPEVTFSGTTLTIHPSQPMAGGSALSVQLGAAAATDTMGNAIPASSKFDFVTMANVLNGTDNDDLIAGHAGAIDAVSAGAGDDTITGVSLDDTIEGGAGIDTAVTDMPLSSLSRANWNYDENQIYLNGTNGHFAILDSVERVQFQDTMLAYDTQPGQNAWLVETLFQAAFGTAPSTHLLSAWLNDVDIHHWDMHGLAAAVLQSYAPTVSTGDLTAYLFGTVLHSVATPDQLAFVESLVGPGHVFPDNAALLAYVAADPMNTDNMDAYFWTQPVTIEPALFT